MEAAKNKKSVPDGKAVQARETHIEGQGVKNEESIAPPSVDNQDATRSPPPSHAKSFNLWATLGVAYSFQTTPLVIGALLVASLIAGGSPFFIYSFIAAFAFNMVVVLSLAELAGFLPHSSGQVFWTAWAAPPAWRRGLSYTAGCFTVMAWIFTLSFVCLLWSQMLLALLLICGATFEIQTWHMFLLYEGLTVFVVLLNTHGYRALPTLAKGVLVWGNAGAFFIAISLLARTAPNYASAKQVWVDVVNETGWDSKGLVFFLSLLPGVTAINAFDAASHLTEEMPNPKKQVPQVMVGTALICGLSGLPMILVYMFCITNEANLLQPIGGQPILQLFVDSLHSLPLSILCTLVYIVLFPVSGAMLVLTTSRMWWSFAQTGALPLRAWNSRVAGASQTPVNAIYVVAGINALLGVLIFGPDAILKNVLGSATACYMLSYSLPIACFLARGRRGLGEKRYFDLGRLGPVLNAVALAWIVVVDFFIIFPSTYPVTAQSMNYTSVVVVGIMGFWAMNWVVHARKEYEGPSEAYEEMPAGERMHTEREDMVTAST